MGDIYRWSEWAPPLIWGGNKPYPGRLALHMAERPPNSSSTEFGHRIPRASTLLETLAKQKLKWHQHLTGPTLARFGPGFVPHHPLVSYSPWLCLILDTLKICMDFGPYDAFPSSDLPEMVDQQNSWNSLVINTYFLYLEWNVGMLAVNICILWPPTPLTHLELCSSLSERKELNPGDINKNSSATIAQE
jgi:hypothetical protein